VVIKVLLATPPQTQEAVKTNVTEAENAKAKVAEIEPEVAQAQAKVAEAEAEIRDAKDEIRDAKAKVAEVEAEIRDAKDEARDAKAKVAEAEVKFNQDPANENWINELKERREALKTANDTLKRKDEALQTATKTLLTANEILKRREEFFFNLRSKSSIGHSGIRFLFIPPSPSFFLFQLVV